MENTTPLKTNLGPMHTYVQHELAHKEDVQKYRAEMDILADPKAPVRAAIIGDIM